MFEMNEGINENDGTVENFVMFQVEGCESDIGRQLK